MTIQTWIQVQCYQHMIVIFMPIMFDPQMLKNNDNAEDDENSNGKNLVPQCRLGGGSYTSPIYID